ncbi:hypothetical protein L596_005509 [Steinernema carpocapsae]|uniref:Ig-like domain-containing protein n=1 Tax=Steinernema carpocapsae TaxID=34508 RepID=A0A4U8UZH5_STECR|nr:hypothetical protein L596_005509 [Steinernema carpocapsae]
MNVLGIFHGYVFNARFFRARALQCPGRPHPNPHHARPRRRQPHGPLQRQTARHSRSLHRLVLPRYRPHRRHGDHPPEAHHRRWRRKPPVQLRHSPRRSSEPPLRVRCDKPCSARSTLLENGFAWKFFRHGVRTVGVRAHKLWFSPEYVEVKAGGKLKLTCIFGGRPVPEVQWSKIDGDLPKKRMKDLMSPESDYGKSLIVENIHPKDAGHYECRSQEIVRRMFVNVSAAPYWEIEEPQHVTTTETKTAELHCLAAGDPQPLIQCRNGKPLYSDEGGQSRKILLDSGRILRIDDAIHKQDAGVYQCNASNPLGYIWANIALDIQAFAPLFHMPIRRIFKVVRGNMVDISCDVTAAPEPIVRWVDTKDQAIQIIPGRIQLFANHTLRIYDVSSADEGEYYCNVSNKYG